MKRRNIILAFSLTAATAAAVLGLASVRVILQEAQTREDIYRIADDGVEQDVTSAVRHSSAGWNPEKSALTIPASAFIDRQSFDSSWQKAKVTPVPRGAVAGVVNHHALAADLLAGFFLSLRASAPETARIIVISPDHFFSGRGRISTHDRSYVTSDGMLESDADFVATLVSSTPALLEDGVMFEHEHGIGALAPFIKHEFPEAKIVSLAFQGSMDRKMARDFGRQLAGMIDDSTIVIISSDMSHYLSAKTALTNDETTINKLKSLDAQFFATSKDDFVDNGVGLLALTSFFDELRLEPSFHLVGHGISSDYVSDDKNTTSYINGIWTR